MRWAWQAMCDTHISAAWSGLDGQNCRRATCKTTTSTAGTWRFPSPPGPPRHTPDARPPSTPHATAETLAASGRTASLSTPRNAPVSACTWTLTAAPLPSSSLKGGPRASPAAAARQGKFMQPGNQPCHCASLPGTSFWWEPCRTLFGTRFQTFIFWWEKCKRLSTVENVEALRAVDSWRR